MHVSGHIAFSSSLLLSSAATAEPGSGLKTSPVANQHMALTRTTHETAVGYQLLGTTLFPNSLLCCYETSSVGSLLQMLITLTANEKKKSTRPNNHSILSTVKSRSMGPSNTAAAANIYSEGVFLAVSKARSPCSQSLPSCSHSSPTWSSLFSSVVPSSSHQCRITYSESG